MPVKYAYSQTPDLTSSLDLPMYLPLLSSPNPGTIHLINSIKFIPVLRTSVQRPGLQALTLRYYYSKKSSSDNLLGGNLMRLDTLQDLLINQLQEIYNAEIQLAENLPKIAYTASSPDLKQAFKSYQLTTQNQITRLSEVFKKLGIDHNHHQCKGMQGLINEENQIINFDGNPSIKDSALITAAQKIEQYEITNYSAARTYARELGYDDIADLLQDTLDEECNADKQLTSLAKGGFFSPGINE
jgi:ferritin-like metal-binding protein YciE